MQVINKMWPLLCNSNNIIVSFVGNVIFTFGIIFGGVLATRASLLGKVLGSFGAFKKLVWGGVEQLEVTLTENWY